MPHLTQCPSCKTKVEYISSQIGENFNCPACRNQFELPVPAEVANPKRYDLPEVLEIHVCNKVGLPIKIRNIIISVERGYTAGPFLTDERGVVRISKKILEEHEKDWISSGGGDHRNFGLIGNLTVSIPSTEIIERWINSRQSTWNVLSEHENKYWATIDQLISAMKSAANYKLKPAQSTISLVGCKGDEKILHKIKTEFVLSNYQKMIIIFSAVIGTMISLSFMAHKK